MNNEESIKKHKGFKIVILIILIVGIIVLKEENRDKLFSFLSSFRGGEIEIQLLNSINIPETLNIEVYGDNICVWRDNKISFFDMDGNLEVEKQFSFESPLLHFGDNYIYIGDKSTGDIYKLDKDGETVKRMDFEKPFFNIVEKNKNTIYHTKLENSEDIYLYDKNDDMIAEYSFLDKNILSYEMENAPKQYTISILDLSENKLTSKIEYYDKKNEKLYDLEIDEEIVIYSQFIDKHNMAALTDKSLYSIKDAEIIWQKSFNLIKDIYIEDNIYILYSNYLESINAQGKTVKKIGFTEDYQKIIPFNRDILVYGQNGFSLVSNGKEILKHEGEIDLLASSKNSIIILKDDKLDIYKVVK